MDILFMSIYRGFLQIYKTFLNIQENPTKNDKVSKNILIYKCQKSNILVKKQQFFLANLELLNPKKKLYCLFIISKLKSSQPNAY